MEAHDVSRPLSLAAFALLLLSGSVRCQSGTESGRTPLAMPQRSIEQVLAERTPEWMSWEGVVGTAQSLLDDGRPCIVIYVAYENEALRARIPEAVEGYPVIIEVSGEFQAYPDTGGSGGGP